MEEKNKKVVPEGNGGSGEKRDAKTTGAENLPEGAEEKELEMECAVMVALMEDGSVQISSNPPVKMKRVPNADETVTMLQRASRFIEISSIMGTIQKSIADAVSNGQAVASVTAIEVFERLKNQPPQILVPRPGDKH